MSRRVLVQIPTRAEARVYHLEGLAAEVVGCVATMRLSPRTLGLLLLMALNDRQIVAHRQLEEDHARADSA